MEALITKIIGQPLKLTLIVTALLVALAVSACGSSSGWSSAQKASLRKAMNADFASITEDAKLTTGSKAALERVENCTLDAIEKHYSPNTKATGSQFDKILNGNCGTAYKAFDKAIAAQIKAAS